MALSGGDRASSTPVDFPPGYRPLKPTMPEVGDSYYMFGLLGRVTVVEPYSDWVWAVEVEVPTNAGHETVRVQVPTDYRTTDDVWCGLL